jgi:transcriptional regulator of acetoin/glycerol metabolism
MARVLIIDDAPAPWQPAGGWRRLQLEQKGISEAFFEALEVYRWPGNMRELMNALKILFLPVINP